VLQILSITTPIFILIGLGFLASKTGLLVREQIRGLGSFVITFAMPALIIRALSESPIEQVFNQSYLIAYAVGSLLVFAGGFCFTRYKLKQGLDISAITAMGMSVSNSGFIGYPIAVLVLGQPAAVALALNMLVENMLMIPLALALAEASRAGEGGVLKILMDIAKRLGKNPMIIAIVVGLLLSALQIRLPVAVFTVVDMLAHAAAPTALFVIGATLYGLKAKGMLIDVGRIAGSKLILHPLSVFLVTLMVPSIDPTLKLAAIVFASAPMMSIYPIMGQRYGLEGRCAAALMVATTVSFFTISALLLFISATP
jgi:predicted permease